LGRVDGWAGIGAGCLCGDGYGDGYVCILLCMLLRWNGDWRGNDSDGMVEMKLNEIKEDGWYWCKSAFHGIYITNMLTTEDGRRQCGFKPSACPLDEWIKADCPFEEGK